MLTAAQYRAKAAEYAELLKAASLPAEVHEFRRLERSYLMLVENEEWMADNRDKINTRGADENSYGDAILARPDRVSMTHGLHFASRATASIIARSPSAPR
jgi:hypothetical protein